MLISAVSLKPVHLICMWTGKKEQTYIRCIKWYTYPRAVPSFCSRWPPCHSFVREDEETSREEKRAELRVSFAVLFIMRSPWEWFVTGQRCVQTQSPEEPCSPNGKYKLASLSTIFTGLCSADNFESGHLKRAYRRPAISRLCLFYTLPSSPGEQWATKKFSVREYYRVTTLHVRLIRVEINNSRGNIAGYRSIPRGCRENLKYSPMRLWSCELIGGLKYIRLVGILIFQ